MTGAVTWTGFRFGIVGAITAAIYVALFTLLSHVGAATELASPTAYLIAILFQFVGHRSFTFRATTPVGASLQRFAVSNGLGLGLGTLLALLLHDSFGLGPFTTGIVVSLALMVINWNIFRLWVFRA